MQFNQYLWKKIIYVMSWLSSLYQQNRENCHLNHSSQVKALLYILAMKIGENGSWKRTCVTTMRVLCFILSQDIVSIEYRDR